MSRRALVAVTVALFALVVPPGLDVGAEAPAELGWWSQSPVASAPPGGFAVAHAANQTVSVAAVRLRLPTGDHSVVLTAPETGGAGQATAAVRVCTTTSTWHAAAPGPWAEAPVADCVRSAVFTRAADGATWTGDVSALVLGGGEVSLMLVPGELQAPEGAPVGLPVPVVPSFEVQFGAPDLRVTLAPPPPEDEGATTDTTLPLFEPEGEVFEELPADSLPPSAFFAEEGTFSLPEPPVETAKPSVPAETLVEPLRPRIASTRRSGVTRSLADVLLALTLALVVGGMAGSGRWAVTNLRGVPRLGRGAL